MTETTALHRMRIAMVIEELRRADALTVLDLGCGAGDLVAALARAGGFTRIVGVDLASGQVEAARARMVEAGEPNDIGIEFLCMSLSDLPDRYAGFDAAVLLEVIEHVDPTRLHRLESAVFARLRPRLVVVTTPNAEYNALLGVAPGRMRHPDHRFEWDRERFSTWAGGVARRNGYEVAIRDLPAGHSRLGGPSQMALFTRDDAGAV